MVRWTTTFLPYQKAYRKKNFNQPTHRWSDGRPPSYLIKRHIEKKISIDPPIDGPMDHLPTLSKGTSKKNFQSTHPSMVRWTTFLPYQKAHRKKIFNRPTHRWSDGPPSYLIKRHIEKKFSIDPPIDGPMDHLPTLSKGTSKKKFQSTHPSMVRWTTFLPYQKAHRKKNFNRPT